MRYEIARPDIIKAASPGYLEDFLNEAIAGRPPGTRIVDVISTPYTAYIGVVLEIPDEPAPVSDLTASSSRSPLRGHFIRPTEVRGDL